MSTRSGTPSPGSSSGEIQDLADLNFADLGQHARNCRSTTADPLRAELESFVNAVRNRTAPEVPAEDGLAAVEVAERIVAAMPKRQLA